MMKPNLLLLLTLFISNHALSAEAKKPDASEEVYGGVSIKEDTTLKKLLVIPEVAAQYESCKNKFKKPEELSEIPNCLWKGDQAAGGKIPELSAEQKDKIQKIYAADEKKSERSPASATSDTDVTAGKNINKTNLTSKSYNVGIDYKSDPTVKALSAFFGKKLDEALNGTEKDKKDKKIATVDQSVFIDLFASELGKSIVNSFTSYCMETDPSCRQAPYTRCLISEDGEKRKIDIKANLEKIKNATFEKDEGLLWTNCIGDVPKVCYENTDKSKPSQYSKQKACIVMDFVKASRKSLIAIDQQKEFYNGLKGGGSDSIASIATNMRVVDAELSSDKLTQITASDVLSKTEDITKSNEQIKTEIDKCDEGGTIDKTKCAKFLDTNTNKNTDAITEFGLKQFAQEDTLTESLNKDAKNINSYLKEEGYDKDQIKALTDNPDQLKLIKDKIIERYKSEKEAIIKEMADRISKKTSTNDGKLEQTDSPKITAIKNELASRTSDMANLIHFNNIVSSYLTIEDQNKKTSRNTASLRAEADSMNGEDAKKLQDTISKNKDLQGSDSNTTLKVQDINDSLLNYVKKEKNP